MAYIETIYCCPTCNRKFINQKEAIKCRNTHPIVEEKRAVGQGGKSVRIYDNCLEDGYGGWKDRDSELFETGWSIKE